MLCHGLPTGDHPSNVARSMIRLCDSNKVPLMEHRDGRVDRRYHVGPESEKRHGVSGTVAPAGRGIAGVAARALEKSRFLAIPTIRMGLFESRSATAPRRFCDRA
jgi:hypothetical protein